MNVHEQIYYICICWKSHIYVLCFDITSRFNSRRHLYFNGEKNFFPRKFPKKIFSNSVIQKIHVGIPLPYSERSDLQLTKIDVSKTNKLVVYYYAFMQPIIENFQKPSPGEDKHPPNFNSRIYSIHVSIAYSYSSIEQQTPVFGFPFSNHYS